MTTCVACGTKIEGKQVEWEGEPVHLVCPSMDHGVIPKGHPYHSHLFWHNVVPYGIYLRNPEMSDEELLEEAASWGTSIRLESSEDGDVEPHEFLVLDFVGSLWLGSPW